MGVVFLIILGTIFYFSFKKVSLETEKKTKTEEGNPMANVISIQCDNVPQGVRTKIECNDEGLVVSSSGYHRLIPYNEILDVTTERFGNTTGGHGFSVGNAIVGTALFGAIGATGGLLKEKYVPKIMMISYVDDCETQYMIFQQQIPGGVDTKYEGHLLDVSCDLINKTIKEKTNID